MLKGPVMCMWESTADTTILHVRVHCICMCIHVHVHNTNMYTMSLCEWVGMPAILREEEVDSYH